MIHIPRTVATSINLQPVESVPPRAPVQPDVVAHVLRAVGHAFPHAELRSPAVDVPVFGVRRRGPGGQWTVRGAAGEVEAPDPAVGTAFCEGVGGRGRRREEAAGGGGGGGVCG